MTCLLSKKAVLTEKRANHRQKRAEKPLFLRWLDTQRKMGNLAIPRRRLDWFATTDLCPARLARQRSMVRLVGLWIRSTDSIDIGLAD